MSEVNNNGISKNDQLTSTNSDDKSDLQAEFEEFVNNIDESCKLPSDEEMNDILKILSNNDQIKTNKN
tara:strand:+ start:705 stop:908 length:204 start_codon:yes stop_codon:yes gene_type:complete